MDLVDQSHEVPLSFFEVLTGMAFAVFADAPVDVCVLEVGMGGTWDNSTNVADGAVRHHAHRPRPHRVPRRHRGTTSPTDKAGIIKPGAVAVLAQQPPEAAEALLRRAAEVGATVAREGLEFGVLGRELAVGGSRCLTLQGLLGDYHDLFLPLFGAHQAATSACAIAAAEAFARTPESDGSGPHSPADEARSPGGALDLAMVRQAAATMSSPGRLEIVRRSPVVVVDAGHNPGGMAASMEALTEAFTFTQLVAILAVSEDKDVAGILDQLEPVAAG